MASARRQSECRIRKRVKEVIEPERVDELHLTTRRDPSYPAPGSTVAPPEGCPSKRAATA
jgi:hypothetical protein